MTADEAAAIGSYLDAYTIALQQTNGFGPFPDPPINLTPAAKQFLDSVVNAMNQAWKTLQQGVILP